MGTLINFDKDQAKKGKNKNGGKFMFLWQPVSKKVYCLLCNWRQELEKSKKYMTNDNGPVRGHREIVERGCHMDLCLGYQSSSLVQKTTMRYKWSTTGSIPWHRYYSTCIQYKKSAQLQ